jgi:putative glycosyltransferase
VSIWFLSGVIIFCQGVIGIYLGKVFAETKRRPISIVRHIYAARPEAEHDRPDRLKRAG